MISIRQGLKFTSKTFFSIAEISSIDTDENKVDVIVTDSGGMSQLVKGWPLDYVKFCFDNDIYTEIDPAKIISVGI